MKTKNNLARKTDRRGAAERNNLSTSTTKRKRSPQTRAQIKNKKAEVEAAAKKSETTAAAEAEATLVVATEKTKTTTTTTETIKKPTNQTKTTQAAAGGEEYSDRAPDPPGDEALRNALATGSSKSKKGNLELVRLCRRPNQNTQT